MNTFDTQAINYYENRADGGFAWPVSYDLSFTNSVIEIDLRVKLVGDGGLSR
jgi:hypothetical protein